MKDPNRIQLIVDETIKLKKLGKKIFLFVNLCEYGEMILKELSKIYNMDEMCLYTGKIKSDDPFTNDKINIIITTYRFCSKGISIPRMDALILCQSRMADTEQTISRILRMGSDTQLDRIIIDIIDSETSISKQYSTRKKVYKKLGCIINKHQSISSF